MAELLIGVLASRLTPPGATVADNVGCVPPQNPLFSKTLFLNYFVDVHFNHHDLNPRFAGRDRSPMRPTSGGPRCAACLPSQLSISSQRGTWAPPTRIRQPFYARATSPTGPCTTATIWTRAETPSLPVNAHMFMVSIGVTAFRDIALGAQAQIATFFASDGETIIHPEPARFFEVPIQGPLPEELNYIP